MSASYIQWVLWVLGLSVQYVVLSALILRGKWRRFPVATIYVSVLMLTTITDITAYLSSPPRHVWSIYYWSAELVRQSAMFAVVVAIGMGAIPEGRRRPALMRLAFLAALVYYTFSLGLLYDPRMNYWMTRVVRNLSFGAAVVNLGVWFYMSAAERRDVTILLLAGGLGLQMTGEAIGQSLRHLMPTQWLPANLLIVGTHLFCMLIWWQAFQRDVPPEEADVRAKAA